MKAEWLTGAVHGRSPAATPSGTAQAVNERLVAWLLGRMTLLLVVPVGGDPGHPGRRRRGRCCRRPSSWRTRKDYMTAGGIWAPLVGTFFLVLHLAAGGRADRRPGRRVSERIRRRQLGHAIVNLAVVNLAGVPSIVHALFGVGAFVLFAGMGRSLLAASLHAGRDDAAGDHHQHARGAGRGAACRSARPAGTWAPRRWQTIRTIVLPNSISGILTGVILQVSRAAGETAPILFTGAVFYVAVADHGWRSFFPYGLGDRCMALSMHLFTLVDAGHAACPTSIAVRHGRRADRPGAGGQQPVDRPAGVPAVAEEVVSRRRDSAHRASTTSRSNYGPKAALRDVSLEIPRQADLRHHRAGQLRQDDAAEVHQPHDRLRRRGQGRRAGARRRRGRLPGAQRVTAAAPGRHGLSAAGRPAAVGLRERGLRAAAGRRARPRASSTRSSKSACARPCSGTK